MSRAYINKLILLSAFVLLSLVEVSCIKETVMEPELTDGDSAVLTIITRSGDNDDYGIESERVVKTLRMIIFGHDGRQLKSFYYNGAALENSMKAEGGVYTITERLPKNLGRINIVLVANEPLAWGLGRAEGITYDFLKNKTIHYNNDIDFVSNNGNFDDLNLYVSPSDYFLMMTETSVDFGSGNIVINDELRLMRMVAKVTLTLQYDQVNGVNYTNGETFEVKCVSIRNQPIYSYFDGKPYSAEGFFPTSYRDFILDSGKNMASETYRTVPVVFYIPEYYLSDAGFLAGLFTYIEIVAEYTTGSVVVPITYRIPLGDGVQKIFDNTGVPQKADYSIVRNHHYIVDCNISNLGEKDGLNAQIEIKDWTDGGNIDVDVPAPYLNVSEIELHRYVSSGNLFSGDSIFYWSNQPQEKITIEMVTTKCYEGSAEKELVDYLPYITTVDVQKVPYSSDGNGVGFFENNGLVKIDLNIDRYIFWDRLEVTFYIKAGNLRRRVNIIYHTVLPPN